MSASPDVIVVGGGPAGLATAIAFGLRGAAVEVFDRRRPPLDKPCGEGLMPDGLSQLSALGVVPEEGLPLRGITYCDGEHRVTAPLPRPGLGVRRPSLHAALVARCEELGVALRWQVGVEGLVEGSRGFALRTARGQRSAAVLVAADGLRSQLRRWSGLGRPEPASGSRRWRPRFGMRRHFAVEPWGETVEVHWSDRVEAYVTPVGPCEVGVAVLWSGGEGGYDTLLGRFPELERRLGGAAPTTRVAGCGPLRQRVVDVVRGNLALVGDASGYLDAITGEGLTLAFRQATALASAVSAGDLDRYRRAHRRLRRLPDLLTHLALLLSRRPALRRRVLAALAAEPGLFARILSVHVGEAGLGAVGSKGALTLLRCCF